jgi:hypothetical protein
MNLLFIDILSNPLYPRKLSEYLVRVHLATIDGYHPGDHEMFEDMRQILLINWVRGIKLRFPQLSEFHRFHSQKLADIRGRELMSDHPMRHRACERHYGELTCIQHHLLCLSIN